jgi:hypothetical protein
MELHNKAHTYDTTHIHYRVETRSSDQMVQARSPHQGNDDTDIHIIHMHQTGKNIDLGRGPIATTDQTLAE